VSRKRGHLKRVTTLSNLGFVDGHRQKVVHEHDPILVAILVARVSPLDSEFNLPADWNANFRMGVQPSVVVVGAVFEGTLTLSGYFRIDHEFCGELTTDGTVVVGADGAAVGNITGQAATDLPSPTVLGQALREDQGKP
jgi:hypothetical protein